MKYIFNLVQRLFLHESPTKFQCHMPDDRLNHGHIKMCVFSDLEQIARGLKGFNEVVTQKACSENRMRYQLSANLLPGLIGVEALRFCASKDLQDSQHQFWLIFPGGLRNQQRGLTVTILVEERLKSL